MSIKNKVILLISSILFFATFSWADLTFSVEDVIAHANTRAKDYNIEKIESAEGKMCIENTIAAINAGKYPEGIQRAYGKSYPFRDDGYAKSVIAHHCGGTL